MALSCRGEAERRAFSIQPLQLSSELRGPTLRVTPGIGTPLSKRVAPRAPWRKVWRSESGTTGRIPPTPAPQVALNFLRLLSGEQCRVWRQGCPRDGTAPG